MAGGDKNVTIVIAGKESLLLDGGDRPLNRLVGKIFLEPRPSSIRTTAAHSQNVRPDNSISHEPKCTQEVVGGPTVSQE